MGGEYSDAPATSVEPNGTMHDVAINATCYTSADTADT